MDCDHYENSPPQSAPYGRVSKVRVIGGVPLRILRHERCRAVFWEETRLQG